MTRSHQPVRVPPALAAGARIAVVAPGSSVRRAGVRSGCEVLRRWGYEPVPAPHLFARDGDLAGPDAVRAADLAWAIDDPSIDAIWAARGGWGTPRLFDTLDLAGLLRRPRWLIGFSDITALEARLVDAGLACLYAPLVSELANGARYAARPLRALLADPGTSLRFAPGPKRTIVRGRAEGTLAGGCLTLIAALAGTPWAPRLRGTIVFLEEVAEAPYRIDRLLWQIRAAGLFDGIAGLALGQFVNCRPYPGRPSRTLAAVLREHAEALGVPCLSGIPAGHGPRTHALPLGYTARLDATRGTLEIVPPAGSS